VDSRDPIEQNGADYRTVYGFNADGDNMPQVTSTQHERDSNGFSVRCFKNEVNDRSSSIDIGDIHLNG
jgi:hypothetical protein